MYFSIPHDNRRHPSPSTPSCPLGQSNAQQPAQVGQATHAKHMRHNPGHWRAAPFKSRRHERAHKRKRAPAGRWIRAQNGASAAAGGPMSYARQAKELFAAATLCCVVAVCCVVCGAHSPPAQSLQHSIDVGAWPAMARVACAVCSLALALALGSVLQWAHSPRVVADGHTRHDASRRVSIQKPKSHNQEHLGEVKAVYRASCACVLRPAAASISAVTFLRE